MHAVSIGDLHLTDDSGKGGLSNYIEEPDLYVMSECQRVLSYAKKNGISNVFFKGDICENPRMSYDAQLALLEFLDRNKRFKFWIILGNHDKFAEDSSQGHSLEIIQRYPFPHVHIITEPEVIKIDGTKIHFHPWPSQDFSKKLLNIAHVEVQGSKMDSGRVFDNEEHSNSKAVVAVGHLHTNHRIRNSYYSGTLYQTYFGESLPKFFHHINFKDRDDYSIDSIPFDPKYKLYTCIVHAKKDLKKLPTDTKHLVKLIIEEGSDIDPESPECQMPNIVSVKGFKTKAELQTILTEDLTSGEELVIRTEEHFNKWLSVQNIESRIVDRAKVLREQLLGGHRVTEKA
jgi:hypothetical protein